MYAIDVVTLFPDFFTSPLATGLVGKALSRGLVSVRAIDPRDFATDRHRTVDDAPYGGGAGMVMKPEPIAAAIDIARTRGRGPVVLMSPQGKPLGQADLVRWSSSDHIVLVAGRYEGFDERIRTLVDEEVSLGDFVLTGGEYAALAIIDGIARLVPGTLGNEGSTASDSFSHGLLEHPHYTRPPEFRGLAVPDILLSGHHARVEKWRRAQAIARTRERRPDLLVEVSLAADERVWAESAGSRSPRVALAIDLSTEGARAAETSLASLGRAYGVLELHRIGVREMGADFPGACHASWASFFDGIDRSSTLIILLASEGLAGTTMMGPRALSTHAREHDRTICFVAGLEPGQCAPAWIDAVSTPIRAAGGGARLSLVSAVSIALDRLVGEG